MVALRKCFPDLPFHLFGKFEGLNPGGSAKDRSADLMITHAIESGALRPDGVVVESSSGNMAIGLAQACCYRGIRLICVIDPKTSPHCAKILQAYGAEVVSVLGSDRETEEFLQARLACVQRLLREIPGSYWPNQYASAHNARAHRETMREIVEGLEGKLDYLFCPVSTCGTIRGCYEYIQQHGLATKLIAVDAVGSIIFGGKRSPRLLPGHGNSIRPELADRLRIDQVVYVGDADCVAGCRLLVKAEGILAGASSGGAIAAVGKNSEGLPPDSNCAVILPDRGERYTDTVYCDEWVCEHFGAIPTLSGLVEEEAL